MLLTRHKEDEQLYVAKFTKRRKVRDYVGQVPLEIYLLSQLTHPHVVPLVDWYKLPHHFAFTMPYLEDYVDLKTFIRLHSRLQEPVARGVLMQTYDALVYCLSVGVDHRDVKHQNILIHQTSLDVKLIDFGLSSVCDSKTVYTSVQGTELFLPPEAVVQRRYTPLESTTWSLGCLLYCMVTGRVPFTSKREVVFSEPHLPAYLSPYCRDLLTQSLHKVRHSRIRFEDIRWHTWMNLDRYRNFLHSTIPLAPSQTAQVTCTPDVTCKIQPITTQGDTPYYRLQTPGVSMANDRYLQAEAPYFRRDNHHLTPAPSSPTMQTSQSFVSQGQSFVSPGQSPGSQIQSWGNQLQERTYVNHQYTNCNPSQMVTEAQSYRPYVPSL